MKKIVLSLAIFFLFITNINAFELSSEHAVLYNMNEDKIIYELAKDAANFFNPLAVTSFV